MNNLKIQFEPYVLEPFTDFYIFPSVSEKYRDRLYRDYQEDLDAFQRDYTQRLRDIQRMQQDRIAERNYDLRLKLKGLR